ncbi:hypothetical protein [Altererythrobacter sp. GH1-8]|uniref:hypothetical protein n=1 Tax=Altererythrobacter sp. GH1-8 TaxID=3349333 RepID=UPI00374D18EB
MTLTSALLVAIFAQGPSVAVEQVDVAYEQMSSGENAAAIVMLESSPELDSDDPSRLINLGVAYAREGNIDEAKALFRAALYAEDRQLVETAIGDWVDSRVLARRALARLEQSQPASYKQVALAESD